VFKDLQTRQSTLEDIFVDLVNAGGKETSAALAPTATTGEDHHAA
jgi:hypothetical protein